MVRAVVGACGLLLAGVAAVQAQEPSGPPPTPRGGAGAGPYVHELLPDIGRIGSQVGAFGGASWNPYDVGSGLQAGGYIDLPLRRAPAGKLCYQVFMGLSLATSEPFEVTDLTAYLLNLASGASPPAALAGPPRAPFTTQLSVRTRLRLLQVSPFGLKYTVTRWDGARLRPYLAGGVDVLVVMTHERPVSGGVGPSAGEPLLAGVLPPAPGVAARGAPVGQGNIELGGHGAAGLEVRVSGGLSLNLEYRFTGYEGGRRLHALTSGLGFHW
jgi:opacity protein-like surface antigen